MQKFARENQSNNLAQIKSLVVMEAEKRIEKMFCWRDALVLCFDDNTSLNGAYLNEEHFAFILQDVGLHNDSVGKRSITSSSETRSKDPVREKSEL